MRYRDATKSSGEPKTCTKIVSGYQTNLLKNGWDTSVCTNGMELVLTPYYSLRVLTQHLYCTNACIPAVFQQVSLTLANNFSTGLWLSTALCCISVAHLQPEIEYHVDGHVIDQSAVHGHVATLRSNGVEVASEYVGHVRRSPRLSLDFSTAG